MISGVNMMKKLTALLLCLTLLCPTALAGQWYSFSGTVPDDLGFIVNGYSGSVTVTFLGDCTLGGEEGKQGSFAGLISRKGYGYPFQHLLKLTAADDLTVANLEGVLSDRTLTRVSKTFNFKGPTAYTGILLEGSVECVTLANNHTNDYGSAGQRDTKAALEAAGIAYFSTDSVAIWEEHGLMIGFVGAFYSLNGSRLTEYKKQIALLKEAGCAAIITVMHAGQEHTGETTHAQRDIARKAAAQGSCLVVGHHPHVVQGYQLVSGIPVAYSLGNCVFGGNSHPDDTDALALQVVLTFEEGELVSQELHFYPIAFSGTSSGNDYSPVLLTGTRAARVLKKMKDSTGYEMPEMTEEGSVIRVDMTE